MSHALLADLALFAHFGFVLFVLIGQLLVVVGLSTGWRWVRNFWFRALHLAAIVWVVGQSWAGIPCPLTILENNLREKAGQGEYPEGFVAYWVHEFLFYSGPTWVFTLVYSLFGLSVLACFLFGPPRWPWRGGPGLRRPCPEPQRSQQ